MLAIQKYIVFLFVIICCCSCHESSRKKLGNFKVLSTNEASPVKVLDSLHGQPLVDRVAVGYKPNHWNYVLLDLETKTGQPFYLQLSQVNIAHVNTYLVDGGEIELLARSGITVPFKERDVKVSNLTFYIPAAKDGKSYVLLQLNNKDGALTTDIFLIDNQEKVLQLESEKNLVLFPLFGIQIFAVLASLIYALVMRNSTFLFYAASSFCMTVNTLMVSGYMHQFFLSESPVAYKIVKALSLSLGILFMHHLSQRFLNARRVFGNYYKRIAQIITCLLLAVSVLIIVGFGTPVLTLLPNSSRTFLLIMGNLSFCAGLLFILYSSIRMALKGSKIALFYTFSISIIILIALAVLLLRNLMQQGELDLLYVLCFGIFLEIMSIGAIVVYQHIVQQKQMYAQFVQTEERKHTLALINAQEEQRSSFAGELHDGIGQQLAVIRMGLNSLLKNTQSTNEERDQLIELQDITNQTAEDTRNLSHLLMPPTLKKLGLVRTIENTLVKCFKHTTVKYTFEEFNIKGRFDENIEITMYRIFQELVNNIIKHASASQVNVQLYTVKEMLLMVVEDDGVGLDKDHALGLGFQNMHKRLQLVNGILSLQHSPGSGLTCTVKIPLSR